VKGVKTPFALQAIITHVNATVKVYNSQTSSTAGPLNSNEDGIVDVQGDEATERFLRKRRQSSLPLVPYKITFGLALVTGLFQMNPPIPSCQCAARGLFV